MWTRAKAAVLRSTGLAVAVSGAYERGSHIWGCSGDPGLLSAAVLGPGLGTADTLATALFATGGAAGDWFGRFGGYDYLAIGTDHRLRMTSGTRRVLAAP